MTHLAFLRAQQRDWAGAADVVRRAAETIDDGSPMQVWDGLTTVIGAVNRQLLPYLDAEEDVLYATLRVVTDSVEPVRLLQVHAKEIERLSAEVYDGRTALLAGEKPARSELRRALYGLYAVVLVHLRARAEVVIPILEAELDACDSEKVDVAMHAIAGHLNDADEVHNTDFGSHTSQEQS